ncbi:MAG: DUF896 domain-containing protein [Anaerovorax sp.]
MKEKIKRINELSKKSKTCSLTPEELQEQKQLREEYLANFRANFKAHLESIKFADDENVEKN